MNVTQLRAFVSVVDLGSFSAAARQAGVSQPAVTMQIKALESDLGATLLERRYHRVELTEAGHALLPHARSVLEDLTNARDDISALSNTVTGRLTIVASTTPGDFIIPRVLGSFLKEHSQVQVEIAVRDSADAVAAVEEGYADLGVCGAESESNKVVFEEVGCDEIIVIACPSHELTSRVAVPYADLVVQDWVVREPGSGTGRMARHALAERRIDSEELRVMVELGSADAVVSAVEGGLGIAMVSSCAAEKALALGTVVRIDMAGDPIVRSFFTALPKSTATRAAAAFAQHLHETVSLAGSPVFSCR